jgi:hypothetical protein
VHRLEAEFKAERNALAIGATAEATPKGKAATKPAAAPKTAPAAK